MPLKRNGRYVFHLLGSSGEVLFNCAVRRSLSFRLRCLCKGVKVLPFENGESPPIFLVIWPLRDCGGKITLRLLYVAQHRELRIRSWSERADTPDLQRVVDGWMGLRELVPPKELAAE